MEKIFLYQNCILCGVRSSTHFCSACFENLPDIPINHCFACLKKIAPDQIQNQHILKCGSCVSNPPAFDNTIAALSYIFPVDALVHALKYQSQLAIAPILAKLLLDKLNTLETHPKPDLIIPMPLHPKRLRERGFNQALEIARSIAKAMNIELIPDGCERIRNTPPQTELPWKSRIKNVHKAFNCKLDLEGKHVVIVDDVMTTGATLNALAQQLRKKGAVKITNWIIARTQMDKIYSESNLNF